jgi:CTP synthase (UTP-ammonia lyase)
VWFENGDVSSPLLISFGEVYVTEQSTEADLDLELNGMYQFLICAILIYWAQISGYTIK